MSTPLADCPPMAPLLAAFARGTKRSRLRLLVVACAAGHTLIEVFPTSAGPYAVWQHKHSWERVDGESVLTQRLEWCAGPLVGVHMVTSGEAAKLRAVEETAAGATYITTRRWAYPDDDRDPHKCESEPQYLYETATCRCTEQAAVDGEELSQWLTDGTRRVVIKT